MYVKRISFSAICVALATVLLMVKMFSMPQGGSVSLCGMLFIALVGYWFGVSWGVMAGIAAGLLQFVLNPWAVHPIQILLDYPLAFGALGLSGLLRNQKYGLYTGYALGVAGRLLFSFLSGMIFYGEFVPEGQPAAVYSILYNAPYMAVEMAITLVILAIPPFRKAIDRVGKFAVS